MTARKVNQVLWDEWRKRVRRQRESGLSIAEFCRREEISAHSFHAWARVPGNSRVSIRGALAHEIVGHRQAALAGRTQALDVLEEAQASIRAARFAPGLTPTERYVLLRDVIARLRAEGLRVRDVRSGHFINQL